MPLSSVNPVFDRLLEPSHRDDSNKWSNIGFTEEITQVVPIEFLSLFCVKFNRGSSLGLPQCSYGAVSNSASDADQYCLRMTFNR